MDARKVGQDLKVGAVLTGEVRILDPGREGGAVVIQAELIDSTDGSQLWAEKYEARAADILSIQEEISRQITKELRVPPADEKHYTNNPEAYQLYLKGRYYWNKRMYEDFYKAIDLFNQAIKKDPNYALAYTGLADSYALLVSYGLVSPREGMPKAKAAALKAIELDESIAEVHTSLAALKSAEWDFASAEKEYKRAIELNPNYVTAHQWYGETLGMLGRLNGAFIEINRALELDPRSFTLMRILASFYYVERAYDEAIEQCKKALQVDPLYNPLHTILAQAYGKKGMYKESIAEYQKASRLHPEGAAKTGRDYKTLGYDAAVRSMRQRQLAWYLKASEQVYVPPELFAEFYALLGEYDKTFEWLEKAYQERSPQLPDPIVALRYEPDVKALRADPRWANLLQRVGIPLKSDHIEEQH